jgi:fatty-acyl-CoA synthase
MRLNITSAFEAAAARGPNRTALFADDEATSYDSLRIGMLRVQRSLEALGVGLGSMVLTLSDNSRALLEVYLALARLGAINVPLNRMLTAVEIAEIATSCQAQLFIHSNELSDLAVAANESSAMRVESIESIALSQAELRAPHVADTTHDSPVAVIFSSGTTGRPKGCVKTHGNHLASVVNLQYDVPRYCNDVELYMIPLSGVGFANFVLPILFSGGALVLERFDPKRAWRVIEQRHVTTGFLAGTMLSAMANCRPSSLKTDSIRLFQTAYQLPQHVRERLVEVFPSNTLQFCYGLTEGGRTGAPTESFLADPNCVGYARAGLDEFAIRDDEGNELPAGETGQIWISGPTVMAGYLEGTTAPSSSGAFATGDLGHTDALGHLYFDGRAKDIVKTGGLSVSASEVEQVLNQHPAVIQAAVLGVPDDYWGERVVACVDIGESNDWDLISRELSALADRQLASFKRPKEYVHLALPLNPSGKVAKGVLLEKVIAHLTGTAS